MNVINTIFRILQGVGDFTRPFGNLSDEELEKQREETRLRLCNGEDVYDELNQFDSEMRLRYRRLHPDEDGELPHSQHGWYLPEDDD